MKIKELIAELQALVAEGGENEEIRHYTDLGDGKHEILIPKLGHNINGQTLIYGGDLDPNT